MGTPTSPDFVNFFKEIVNVTLKEKHTQFSRVSSQFIIPDTSTDRQELTLTLLKVHSLNNKSQEQRL